MVEASALSQTLHFSSPWTIDLKSTLSGALFVVDYQSPNLLTGRAYFQNCNGTGTPQPGESGESCSGEETIVVSNGQEARLDLRVLFRDGGNCENQSIRSLDVMRDGAPIYSCPNILNSESDPCPSTDKYRADSSQCPQDCVGGTELQCCKFRFFLVIMSVNASDFGQYVASILLEDGGGERTTITKTFLLEMSPGMNVHICMLIKNANYT